MSLFHIGFKQAFLSAIYKNGHKMQEHSHFFDAHTSIPFLILFPILLITELLRVFVPTTILLMDVRTSFLTMVPQDLKCLVFESVASASEVLGMQLPMISTIFEHLPFLPECTQTH